MSKKILIVEDEKDIASAFKKQLSLIAKYEVEIADGGQKALDMLKESQYDLILLDLAMPHVDGISVLQYLKDDKEKKDQEYHHAPVIILTNVTSDETQEEVNEFEIADYIVKSDVDYKSLIEKVQKAMS